MVITDIQFLVTGFRFEEPMKVAFATITDMDSCIVKVLTDEGITGYGEAAPLPFVTGDNLDTVLAVGKDLRDALLGMDPRAIGAGRPEFRSTNIWEATTRTFTRMSRSASTLRRRWRKRRWSGSAKDLTF